MPRFTVGSLVKCRARDWVVLPSDEQDEMLLRPLGGSELEICGISLPLEGHDLQATSFPLPNPSSFGDFISGQLLYDASRLTLRNGSGPFRSLGRIAIRPRPYQLVPLLMGMRLNPIRILIADDVGVGKTIEAGLIVRELFDRGEIRRLTVLCPPHLCDQWQRELRDKFAFDAVIVRSKTVARLHRGLSQSDMSIFEQYPITVASIDYVKTERHRADFLRACPPCVIVDEAHTATIPRAGSSTQQQRYNLVCEVANDPNRHLLLLTATPHSGIEDSFQSLLGLLHPSFANLDLANLSEPERDTLARHFIQRRRADVVKWLDEETPFPQRRTAEVPYALPPSSPYRNLFDAVYRFVREHIREQADTPAYRQRVRYWAALALLRCVMSSPAAAEKALHTRAFSAQYPDQDVLETLISNLFQPTTEQLSFLERAQQMSMGDIDDPLRTIEQQWEWAVVQERESRTRFAQRRIKPEEVAREMQESTAVLGDASSVERFVRNACERLLGNALLPETTSTGKKRFRLPLSRLPDAIGERIGSVFFPAPTAPLPEEVFITFDNPPPENTHEIGRNHPLTIALAEYLLEIALSSHIGDEATSKIPATRSSLIRSRAVSEPTILVLLRVRMLMESSTSQMLAEELVVTGFHSRSMNWLGKFYAY